MAGWLAYWFTATFYLRRIISLDDGYETGFTITTIMTTIEYTSLWRYLCFILQTRSRERKQVNVGKDQLKDVDQLYWSHLQRISFEHGWIDLPVVAAAVQTSRLAFLVLSSNPKML